MNTIFVAFCLIIAVAMAIFAARALYCSLAGTSIKGGQDAISDSSYPARIMAAENDGELLEESNENYELNIPDNVA